MYRCPVYYVTGNHEYWLEKSEHDELMDGLDDSSQSDDNQADDSASDNTQGTEDGFCGLKSSYKDDYKA